MCTILSFPEKSSIVAAHFTAWFYHLSLQYSQQLADPQGHDLLKVANSFILHIVRGFPLYHLHSNQTALKTK